jgi:hypothetical protein
VSSDRRMKAKTGKKLEDECLEHVQGKEDRHA